LKSLYFWWWTPSTLTIAQTRRIIGKLRDAYGFDKNVEISLESTPNKINEAYVEKIKNIWINRLSIGVQSLNENTLKEIGRWDKWNIMGALESVKKNHFVNVSVDFIIGLPYVKKWEVKRDIKYLLQEYPFIKHISVYMLEDYYDVNTDEKSKFHSVVYPDNWYKKWIHDEEFTYEYEEVSSFLKENGFLRYEISNFAKPWYECKHNQSYWNHSPVIAFWLWASGFVDWERYSNSEDFQEYYKKENIFREKLKPSDMFLEQIMFWLRTAGIPNDIISLLDREKVNDFLESWFLFFDTQAEKLRIADKGIVFLDYIIKEII
jgi:oxygen-independent coproporphyrinogen-3 oxidase